MSLASELGDVTALDLVHASSRAAWGSRGRCYRAGALAGLGKAQNERQGPLWLEPTAVGYGIQRANERTFITVKVTELKHLK
jgi:hypothetical protein